MGLVLPEEPRRIPPASTAPVRNVPFCRISYGRYQASFTDGEIPLPTALENTAR
jgi:hypothetical protein